MTNNAIFFRIFRRTLPHAPGQSTREPNLQFVEERQKMAGGITGEDLARVDRLHGLGRNLFCRRVDRLFAKNPRFRHIQYLGKRAPRFDLDDSPRWSRCFRWLPSLHPSPSYATSTKPA